MVLVTIREEGIPVLLLTLLVHRRLKWILTLNVSMGCVFSPWIGSLFRFISKSDLNISFDDRFVILG